MSYIENLQSDNFQELILQAEKVSVVHFSADYCRPCQQYSTFLKDLKNDETLEFNVGEVDIQHNIDLRRHFNIRLLPTTIFFSEGAVIDRKEGILSLEDIYEVINLA